MDLSDLTSRLSDAALLFDFDGVLSPIVADPAAAGPVPGVIGTLSELASRAGLVGVVSGRPVSFLAEHVTDPAIELSGLYGLQFRRGGELGERHEADEWRHEVEAAVGQAAGLPEGVTVESKGLSLTVHYRTVPEAHGDVYAWALEVGLVTGLDVRPAKQSFELHPPLSIDKGHAVKDLVGDLPVAMYAGDDLGDLPAFEALSELRIGGRSTLSVAVLGPETPDEIRGAADVEVEGPQALAGLLGKMVGDAP